MAAREWNRREVFVAGGRAAALGGTAWLTADTASAIASATEDPAGAGAVTVRQGTNIAADIAPDGQLLAMDLATGIWVVPATGGAARRLTDDFQDATRPRFSPDSRQLVFQSYRDGNFHLWLVNVDGTGLRQLTSGPHDHREPCFSPDGTQLACSSDRGRGYGIWAFDLRTGAISAIVDGAEDESDPAWSPDGQRLMFTVDGSAIDEVRRDGSARRRIVESEDEVTVSAPSYAPDGRTVAHTRLFGPNADLVVGDEVVTRDEDVFQFGARWVNEHRVLYTADGVARVRDLRTGNVREIAFTASLPFRRHHDRPAVRDIDDCRPQRVRGIASPVLSPDGGQLAFRALGALWLLPIGQRARRIVADEYFNSDPDWFPNGRSLVYSSDRDGTPALWRYDLDAEQSRKLLDLPGAQVTPRCAPDGQRIAYQDEDGGTWVVDLRTGKPRSVLPALFQPGRPSWSADGRTLALAAVKPRSHRYREGTSQILTVHLPSGEVHYAEPMPFTSLSTRGDDGPVWSPDGRRLAFVVASRLHVVDVDDRGRFQSVPRPITEEITDAPSWGPDCLVYLNNGRLRQVAPTGGSARTIDVPLTWQRGRSRPRGRFVLRAGAMWDGVSDELRRDVDVLIEGGHIREVAEQSDQHDGTLLDARNLTVMPGLVDAHVHWHLRGRQWGSRQQRLWLSYGVTTVRSPGDPAYQMLETREALDSGAFPGPRYFATGEALDGGRVYYNFMRQTLDAAAAERELERAAALDYDLIKTYVRLPASRQAAAVDRAHQRDVPLTSHYLYPAVQLGMDGMEHTGATNRLGYSHTTSELGRSYEDAVRLFAASGMSITPTLFTAAALLRDDRSLVDDERTRVLYPPWEYEALLAKAELAGQDTPFTLHTRQALVGNVSMLLRIHRAGGFLIAGTDAPLDDVAISLHQNLRAMVAGGFTPHEALTIATANPARWLGLGERIGAVRVGMLADLAVVRGDPLRDIRAAADVRLVLADGAPHWRDELVAPFRGGADSRPPTPMRTPTPTAAPATPASAHWWHGESERAIRLCC